MAIILACAAAQAQTPNATAPPRASATLDVKQVAVNKQITTNWKDDYGAYQKDFVRSGDLEIKISTVGRVPIEGQAAWYFVGKPVDGNVRSIVAQGSKAVTVAAPGSTVIKGSSGEIAATDNKYTLLGVRDTKGKRMEGWIVVLKDKLGRELDAKASNSYLLDWFRQQKLTSGAPVGARTAPR